MDRMGSSEVEQLINTSRSIAYGTYVQNEIAVYLAERTYPNDDGAAAKRLMKGISDLRTADAELYDITMKLAHGVDFPPGTQLAAAAKPIPSEQAPLISPNERKPKIDWTPEHLRAPTVAEIPAKTPIEQVIGTVKRPDDWIGRFAKNEARPEVGSIIRCLKTNRIGEVLSSTNHCEGKQQWSVCFLKERQTEFIDPEQTFRILDSDEVPLIRGIVGEDLHEKEFKSRPPDHAAVLAGGGDPYEGLIAPAIPDVRFMIIRVSDDTLNRTYCRLRFIYVDKTGRRYPAFDSEVMRLLKAQNLVDQLTALGFEWKGSWV